MHLHKKLLVLHPLNKWYFLFLYHSLSLFLFESLCCLFHLWFPLLEMSGRVLESPQRWTETLRSVNQWNLLEAHCVGSWRSCIFKYWLYGLVLCVFWIRPEILFLFFHHAWPNASNLTLYVIVLTLKSYLFFSILTIYMIVSAITKCNYMII